MKETNKIMLLIFLFLLFGLALILTATRDIRIGGYVIQSGKIIQDGCKVVVNYGVPLINDTVLYFKFDNDRSSGESNYVVCDFSGNGNTGYVDGASWKESGGRYGDGAYEFDGIDDTITVMDDDSLSPSKTGEMSFSFWIKFKNTNFKGEADGYVDYLTKADINGYEWIFRQYNASNMDGKSNRLGLYVFNITGGSGIGSYSQDEIIKDEWIHIAGVINKTNIQFWKNGNLVDEDILSGIVLENGNAPLVLGTGSRYSFFNGSMDELRIFKRALSKDEIILLYNYSPNNLGDEIKTPISEDLKIIINSPANNTEYRQNQIEINVSTNLFSYCFAYVEKIPHYAIIKSEDNLNFYDVIEIQNSGIYDLETHCLSENSAKSSKVTFFVNLDSNNLTIPNLPNNPGNANSGNSVSVGRGNLTSATNNEYSTNNEKTPVYAENTKESNYEKNDSDSEIASIKQIKGISGYSIFSNFENKKLVMLLFFGMIIVLLIIIYKIISFGLFFKENTNENDVN